VLGGLGTLFSFPLLLLAALLVILGLSDNNTPDHLGLGVALLMAIVSGILLLALAFSSLFIWGGVRVLKGRKTMLMVVSIIQVVLTVLGLVSDVAIGTIAPGTVVGALAGLVAVSILILLGLRSSKEFFRARSAGTI
jgi:hypothetical protein